MPSRRSMKPLTWELKAVYSYYTGSIFLPVQVSKLEQRLRFSPTYLPFYFFPKYKLIIYLISRIPPVLNFFTTAFEIGKTIQIYYSTGNLSIFYFFGLILWQLCIPALFFAVSRGFSHYFVQTTNLMYRIWRKCELSVDPLTLKEIRQSNSSKVRRFMLHTFLIDLMTIFNFATSSWGHPEEDPTLIFLFFPWTQSSTGKFLYWIVQNENAFLSIMSWAAIISFPGVLELHLECVLKGLDEAVNNGRLENYPLEEIMKDYKQLEFAIKELNRNSFSTCLLLFYLECGTEQTSSSFCIFQLIKSGAKWEEWQYFFLDTLYTTTKIVHSFHVLSRMDDAAISLTKSIKKQWNMNHVPIRRKVEKVIQRQLLCLQDAGIYIGPCRCTSDLPLSGMSVYMDNIVNAALWPYIPQ